MLFWVGGNTIDGTGDATGIGLLDAGAEEHAAGTLGFAGDAVAVLGSPSWVQPHPTLDVVYAAHETEGVVRAYRRVGERNLVRFGEPVGAGSAVCHVGVAADGSALIASCWGDGRVVRMPLDSAGGILSADAGVAAVDPYGPDPDARTDPGDPGLRAATAALRAAAGAEFAHLLPEAESEPEAASEADAGAEPAEGEERVSRAHQAAHLPGGVVATTDMGFDLVRFWRGADLRPLQDVVLPRGSGPRHMRWHPSGHLYVLTELSREVFVLAPDSSGRWRVVSGVPLPEVLPGDTAAELAPSRRQDFLYAGIRGSNTLATLRVRRAGDALEVVALDDSGVDKPRHHIVVDDIVLIAGQSSGDVVSRRLDERTGIPGPVRDRTAVPTPTCLAVA